MKICRKNRVVSLIHSFCHRRNVTAKLGSSHHSRRVSEGSLLFVLSFFKIFILQPELINDCLSPSMSKVKYVEWLLVKVPTYRLSELSAISEESLRKEWLSLVCGQRSQVNRIESLCQEVRILGHFATQEFVGLSPWMVHFFFIIIIILKWTLFVADNITVPKDVCILIHRTCEYTTFMGKMDLADWVN